MHLMAEAPTEHFETHKPQVEDLKPYIAYYYFNSSKTKRYMFYPHYRNALTVYKHSRITFGPNRSFVEPCYHKPYEIIFTGIQEFCRYGEIKAPFDKIGVVFQTMGLNHFLKMPLILPSSDLLTAMLFSSFSGSGKAFSGFLEATSLL